MLATKTLVVRSTKGSLYLDTALATHETALGPPAHVNHDERGLVAVPPSGEVLEIREVGKGGSEKQVVGGKRVIT